MKSNLISTIGIIICSFIGSALAEPITQLTLVKEVSGGEATVTDWVLTADGTDDNDLSGAGYISGFVAPDTFLLSESTGPTNYTAGDWNCIGGGSLDGQSLTLLEGDVVTCTIINTYVPPVVVFDTDFALPSMPVGDGAGTPVCVDDKSGLLMAGCDVTITADQIDPSSVQKRVDETCEPGSAMRVISSTGAVTCQAVGNWSKAGGGHGWLNLATATGTYFFPESTTWTAPVYGYCAVTMTARTSETSATGTFNIRTAREANGTAANDASDTHYGVQSVSPTWYVGTVTHTWSISAGNTYRFGCYVDADGSFTGNNFWCRVSYVCTP